MKPTQPRLSSLGDAASRHGSSTVIVATTTLAARSSAIALQHVACAA